MKFETRGGHVIIFAAVKLLNDDDNAVYIDGLMDAHPTMEKEEYRQFKVEYFHWLEREDDFKSIVVNSIKSIENVVGYTFADVQQILMEAKRL